MPRKFGGLSAGRLFLSLLPTKNTSEEEEQSQNISISHEESQMQPSISFSTTQSHFNFQLNSSLTPLNLRFCGFRRDVIELSFSRRKRPENQELRRVFISRKTRSQSLKVSASADDNGNPAKSFDYDIVIIGAGVGGHGAALHAVEKVYSNSSNLIRGNVQFCFVMCI